MSSEKVVKAPANDGSKKTAAAPAAPAEEVNLDLLEEDDEFEEFPAETWTGVEEDAEDVQLWGDNWDDDDAHYDDFANQLREELKKSASAQK